MCAVIMSARERAALALHNRLESAVDQLLAFSRAALAAVALSTLMSGCGKPAAQPAGGGMPPPEVNAVTVQPHDVPVTFEYVGQTAGVREVEVRARVTGILERWNYREGAAVRAGDSLFTIDPAPFQAAVARAEAELASAEARRAQATAHHGAPEAAVRGEGHRVRRFMTMRFPRSRSRRPT